MTNERRQLRLGIESLVNWTLGNWVIGHFGPRARCVRVTAQLVSGHAWLTGCSREASVSCPSYGWLGGARSRYRRDLCAFGRPRRSKRKQERYMCHVAAPSDAPPGQVPDHAPARAE